MADRWMDERDRQWRSRDGRRTDDREGPNSYGGREDRSFDRGFEARRSGPDRDRVFGEEDTGVAYNRPGAPGRYQDYREAVDYGAAGRDRPAWQERDYGGVSPAMQQGEYELENRRLNRDRNPRFGTQDYTAQDYSGGGRYYGDDARADIYREEYGQGGVEYGREPRGYDAGQSYSARRGTYGGAGGDYGYRARPAYGGPASGGNGGYDYERGYGDGGRRDLRHGEEGGAADFLYRAGRKVREWFRGDDLMQGSDRPERAYRAEGRGYLADRDHRGRGPKGYKRSDERIGDEINERLTDDSWLDATGVEVSVTAGEVTLSGSVDSREAKHRAERIAEDVSGVAHVQNNLRVAANPITGSGHGFGDSAAAVQARRDDPTANGSGGAAGTTPGANGSGDDRL